MKLVKCLLIIFLITHLAFQYGFSQTAKDTFNGHGVILDSQSKIISWIEPQA